MKKTLKTSSTLKVCNVQNVYLSGRRVTMFDVYTLKDGAWIFDYNDYIHGWYKRADTVLDKILIK